MTGLLSIPFVLMAIHADARDFFSKQYGLPCGHCHAKIPILNDIGQEFKNNGYSLEKRLPNRKDTPVRPENITVEPKVSPPVTAARESVNEKSDADSTLKTAPPPPPVISEHLYRSQTKDGTYIFTDNPLYPPDELSSAETFKHGGNSQKNRKNSVNKNKPVFSGISQEKLHKTGAGSKVTTAARRRGGAAAAATQQAASLAKALPRNYEDCMEKILILSSEPKNSAEAMEQFEKSERICTPYVTAR